MDKDPKLVGKWGPLPVWSSPLSEKEQQQGKANQALLRLMLDTRYYLRGELQRGWVPSSPEDFARTRAEFHRSVDAALMGYGDPSYLHHLADQIAIFEDRKNPPPLPRSDRTKIVIEECFLKLWIEGDNWLTRKGFFTRVCAELTAQERPLITYRHFVRILEDVGLDGYFPPMRRRRKHHRRSERNVAETFLVPISLNNDKRRCAKFLKSKSTSQSRQ
jgi:hypothetical protein